MAASEILLAVKTFSETRDYEKFCNSVQYKTYDGRFLVKNVVTAFPHRHAILETVDVYSGERKWLRFIWVNPVDAELTMREFYVLRSLSGLRALPTLEHVALQDNNLLVAIYKALPPGARTLAREMEGPPGSRGQQLSAFRLVQIVHAVFDAILELEAKGFCMLDLRPENIWLCRGNYSEDNEGNLLQAKARNFTDEDNVDPQHPQRRLGMNHYREHKLQVTFLECENLYLSAVCRKQYKVQLPQLFLSKLPLFFKQFGLPELFDKGQMRWVDVQLYKIRELGHFLVPEIIRSQAKKRAPEMFNSSTMKAGGEQGDDEPNNQISSPTGTTALDDDAPPKDKKTLAKAQRWALGRLLVKLLEAVTPEQAPAPRKPDSTLFAGEEKEVDFSSPSRKCVGAKAYLLPEIPVTSAEETTVDVFGNDDETKNTTGTGQNYASSASPDIYLVSSPKKLSGGDTVLAKDVVSRIESVGLETANLEERINQLEQDYASMEQEELVIAPPPPGEDDEDGNNNNTSPSSAKKKKKSKSASPSPSRGGSSSPSRAGGASAKTPKKGKSGRLHKVIFRNGIGLNGSYAYFYDWWRKWVEFGLPEDGVTIRGLRYALAQAVMTKDTYAAESHFSMLDEIVPFLLHLEHDRGFVSLADMAERFQRRVDTNFVENQFYAMPRLMTNSVWDLSQITLTSAHAWRVLETLQIAIEKKAKIKVQYFASPYMSEPEPSLFSAETDGKGGAVRVRNSADGSDADEKDSIFASSSDKTVATTTIAYQYPSSPSKRKKSLPTLGPAEQEVLVRYVRQNPRGQKFFVQKLKSKGGLSEKPAQSDGTMMPASVAEQQQDASNASPTNGSKPQTPSVAQSGINQKLGGSAGGAGTASVGGSSSSSKKPKEERRIFSELAGYDATGEQQMALERNKRKVFGVEYLFLPRKADEKTVVDWESDAMSSNTCFLYASLCEYLVLHGKLKDPVQAIHRFVSEMQTPTSLRFLSLRNVKCFDKGALQVILATKTLEYLDLTGNCLTDTCLAEWEARGGVQATSPALRALLLGSNAISAVGVQSLMNMLAGEEPTVLEVLDFSDNCCAGAGTHIARHFAKNPNSVLHTVSLRQNGIVTQQELLELAAAIRDKGRARDQHFLTLDLEGNQFGEAGAGLLLAEAERGRLNLRHTGPSLGFFEKTIAQLNAGASAAAAGGGAAATTGGAGAASSAAVPPLSLRPFSSSDIWAYTVKEPRTKISYLDRLSGDPAGGSDSQFYLEVWASKPESMSRLLSSVGEAEELGLEFVAADP